MVGKTVSINPTYYCNFRCDFCYLTKEQLSDLKIASVDAIMERIDEILQFDVIDFVDIYGGEVMLFGEDYLNNLLKGLRDRMIFDINIVTNGSVGTEWLDKDVVLTFSYDFEQREMHQKVFTNMALTKREFSILILASKDIVSKNVDEMISMLNLLDKLVSVEIKPYSTNQANCHNVSFSDYEEFVKKWITSPVSKNFEFVNKKRLSDVVSGNGYAYSDDHIYITPSARFGVLEFDLNDNEFFLEMDTYDEYVKWCDIERTRVSKNKFCSSCEYSGKCLSEHLRKVESIEKSCNGFYNLIKWYERLES